MSKVQLTREGPLAIVSIDRQERRNALDSWTWQAIAARVEEAADARVLILTGVGPHFSAGLDLKPDNPLAAEVMQAVSARDRAAAIGLIERIKSWMAPIAAFKGLSVAAIEGSCLGGGLELALHCDVRIAGHGARFALPEPRWGMVPDVGGATRLTRLVGPGRAALVIASGRKFSTEEAFELGFIEQRCADGSALDAARELGLQSCQSAPTALREAIALIRELPGLSQDEANERESAAGAAALLSGEVMAGMMAFATRRPPPWAP